MHNSRLFVLLVLVLMISTCAVWSRPYEALSDPATSRIDSLVRPTDSLSIERDSLLGAVEQPINEIDSVSQQELAKVSSEHPSEETIKGVMYELPRQLFSWFRNMSKPQMALLCNIIPGGGQLYNKKYWKVPLVLTLAAGCGYAIARYGGQYNEYHEAYRDFMNEDPLRYDSWKAFLTPGSNPEDYVGDANLQGRLKKGNDLYRRYRDLTIMLSCLVYILTFVDAYVDAQLADFDISPNLSMLTSDTNPLGGADWKIPTVGVAIRF